MFWPQPVMGDTVDSAGSSSVLQTLLAPSPRVMTAEGVVPQAPPVITLEGVVPPAPPVNTLEGVVPLAPQVKTGQREGVLPPRAMHQEHLYQSIPQEYRPQTSGELLSISAYYYTPSPLQQPTTHSLVIINTN